MPWKDTTVPDLRLAFIHAIESLGQPMAATCRQFGISRRVGYKWLNRYRAGGVAALRDRSRRPAGSPNQTPTDIEQAILGVRCTFGWGARKIHAYLAEFRRDLVLPSMRTVHAVLRRHKQVGPSPNCDPADQRFERSEPNELWQLDFKGYFHINRQKVIPLTILDDHSRYLLRHHPVPDMTHQTTWQMLWDLMGEVGMPQSVLCDNHFRSRTPATSLSWFDAQLIRLDIRPTHGRVYHPQTQGKVERIHRTLKEEAYPRVDCSDVDAFCQGIEHWRTAVYNTIRPHEALGMKAPISRWKPSLRTRPVRLPEIVYPAGATLRKVQKSGWIQFRNCNVLVGQGIAGQCVELCEQDGNLQVRYSHHTIRNLAIDSLKRYGVN